MFSQCVYSASWSDSDFIPEGKQNIECGICTEQICETVAAVIFIAVCFLKMLQ